MVPPRTRAGPPGRAAGRPTPVRAGGFPELERAGGCPTPTGRRLPRTAASRRLARPDRAGGFPDLARAGGSPEPDASRRLPRHAASRRLPQTVRDAARRSADPGRRRGGFPDACRRGPARRARRTRLRRRLPIRIAERPSRDPPRPPGVPELLRADGFPVPCAVRRACPTGRAELGLPARAPDPPSGGRPGRVPTRLISTGTPIHHTTITEGNGHKKRLGGAQYASQPLEKIRRRPTLPGGSPPSTIGAGGLHFRVRNGNGCFPAAIATGNLMKLWMSLEDSIASTNNKDPKPSAD